MEKMKTILIMIFISMVSCRPLTVRVCNQKNENGMCGNGFVDGHRVITATHNVKSNPMILEYKRTEGIEIGDLKKSNYVTDVAELTSTSDVKKRNLKCKGKIGKKIWIYTQISRSLEKRKTSRIIKEDELFYYADYIAIHGDSGSPVAINKYCIIGIVIANTPDGVKIAKVWR
jgi:V8-like Glu-specific endopeptidase